MKNLNTLWSLLCLCLISVTVLAQNAQPFLGVKFENTEKIVESDGERIVEKSGSDVAISGVVEGSAAAQADLQAGDILTAINKDKVEGYDDLKDALSKYSVGEVITVQFLRNGKKQSSKVTLGTIPEEYANGEKHIEKDLNRESLHQHKMMTISNACCPEAGQNCCSGSAKVATNLNPNAPMLGIIGNRVYEMGKHGGLLIDYVGTQTAASEAGLKKGDLLLSINQTTLNSHEDLTTFMKTVKVDDQVSLVYKREGVETTAKATLKKRSEHNMSWNHKNTNCGEYKSSMCGTCKNNFFVLDDETAVTKSYVAAMKNNKVFLGIYHKNHEQGVLIEEIIEKSAAEKANLQTNDIITRIGTHDIKNMDDLYSVLGKFNPGDLVEITYLREGKKSTTSAELGTHKNQAHKIIMLEDGAAIEGLSDDILEQLQDMDMEIEIDARNIEHSGQMHIKKRIIRTDDEGNIITDQIMEEVTPNQDGNVFIWKEQHNNQDVDIDVEDLGNGQMRIKKHTIEKDKAGNIINENISEEIVPSNQGNKMIFLKEKEMESIESIDIKQSNGEQKIIIKDGNGNEDVVIINEEIEIDDASPLGDKKIRVITKVLNETEKKEQKTQEETIEIKMTINGENETTRKVIITDGQGNVIEKEVSDGESTFVDDDNNRYKMKVTTNEDGSVTTNVMSVSILIMDLEETDKAIIDQKMEEVKDMGILEVEDINFYPNPSNGEFDLNFTLPNEGETAIRIVDMSGREIFKENMDNFSGNAKKRINISDNKQGVYFLQLIQGNKVLVKKIVIQ